MASVERKCITNPLRMPLHEVVARAGTFEGLRPSLMEGHVRAWAAHFYSGPRGGEIKMANQSIDPSWWANARVDTPSDRAYFPMDYIDMLAIGIEVERAPVEARWPLGPDVSTRQRRGRKPSPVWQQIFLRFDPVVAREGPFPSIYSAASTVERWLEKNNKSLSRRAIERGILKYRQQWVTA